MNLYLIFAAFFVSLCGIIYELLAGTISSYLVGDSVYQFSLVIGIFMSSMGLGSFLSRYVNDHLPQWFILVEVLVGVVGGLSSIILFFAFTYLENYEPFLYLISITVGTLIGLEIPIILRLLKKFATLKILVSNVMTADYVGALVASLAFPLFFVPRLGLVRTSLVFGILNVGVGALGLRFFEKEIPDRRPLAATVVAALLLLGTCLVLAGRISSLAEDVLYKDDIIFAANTPYQRVVVTRNRDDIRMFINGSIQFCSKDEYRYHEPLVHPAMLAAGAHEKILIVGGGDGLAAREVLRYPDVGTLTVVDIDPAITAFATDNKIMRNLNRHSFHDPRTRIVNADAWKFMEKTEDLYDVIIIDLPDPDNLTLSRLYSRSFYRLLSRHLAAHGILVTQATSPMYSRKAFWCIFNTLAGVESPFQQEKFLNPVAFHTYVPSFGTWGFVMASPRPIAWATITPRLEHRFLTPGVIQTMTVFPPDQAHLETEVNSIDTHKIKAYYEEGWKSWHL